MAENEKTKPLFRDQSEAFRLFRPEYPEALYDWIGSIIPENQRGSVIDIACGTGKSTTGLTRVFQQVYGLDLEIAQITKAKAQFPDIQFLLSKAECCPIIGKSMDCVSVATAFYWFHMGTALEEFRRLLRPQGHMFIYHYYYPVPASEKILDIQRREYEEHWRYHRDPRLSLDVKAGDVLKQSQLCGKIDYQKFPNEIQMDAAQMKGFWSSTSYGAAYAKNIRDPKGYWQSLQDEFDRILKGKTVTMDFTIHAWHGQLIA